MPDILFLPISGPRGASTRYRVLQFLPALDAAALTYQLHFPPTLPAKGFQRLLISLKERRQITATAEDARTIFIQKRLFPVGQISALARMRPLLFDLDDAIFTSPTGNRSRWAQRRVETRLRHVLASAHVVIAGNRYLCDYARPFAREVVHLPTVLDSSRYPLKVHDAAEDTVVGWIGHSVNHPYLAALGDVLKRLAGRMRIRLLVVSDRDLTLPGVTVENRRWSEATEVADILAMDVGIMPLPDDPWSRGKCGFKAIQYMAAGIPVVCSAVGANLDIVRDGVDGHCVRTDAQWQDALAELCADAALRQRMGSSARERVCSTYSLEQAVPVLIALLQRLARAG